MSDQAVAPDSTLLAKPPVSRRWREFANRSFTRNAWLQIREMTDWFVPNRLDTFGWFRNREGRLEKIFFSISTPPDPLQTTRINVCSSLEPPSAVGSRSPANTVSGSSCSISRSSSECMAASAHSRWGVPARRGTHGISKAGLLLFVARKASSSSRSPGRCARRRMPATCSICLMTATGMPPVTHSSPDSLVQSGLQSPGDATGSGGQTRRVVHLRIRAQNTWKWCSWVTCSCQHNTTRARGSADGRATGTFGGIRFFRRRAVSSAHPDIARREPGRHDEVRGGNISGGRKSIGIHRLATTTSPPASRLQAAGSRTSKHRGFSVDLPANHLGPDGENGRSGMCATSPSRIRREYDACAQRHALGRLRPAHHCSSVRRSSLSATAACGGVFSAWVQRTHAGSGTRLFKDTTLDQSSK